MKRRCYIIIKSDRIYFTFSLFLVLTLSQLTPHDALLRTATVCFTVHASCLFQHTAVFLGPRFRSYPARLLFRNVLLRMFPRLYPALSRGISFVTLPLATRCRSLPTFVIPRSFLRCCYFHSTLLMGSPLAFLGEW